jgi:hypothetical protein
MNYMVRRSIMNDRPCLTVWRRLERTYSQGARAYQTASGYWIVSINNQQCDVAVDEQAARIVLVDYASKLPN